MSTPPRRRAVSRFEILFFASRGLPGPRRPSFAAASSTGAATPPRLHSRSVGPAAGAGVTRGVRRAWARSRQTVPGATPRAGAVLAPLRERPGRPGGPADRGARIRAVGFWRSTRDVLAPALIGRPGTAASRVPGRPPGPITRPQTVHPTGATPFAFAGGAVLADEPSLLARQVPCSRRDRSVGRAHPRGSELRPERTFGAGAPGDGAGCFRLTFDQLGRSHACGGR